ncbi:probable serine/threonine-protein kinase irlC isoform X2 [Oppia nitens]|nr:probable serine/threonine-protein kinase irlC isoform X2 [Oppia nitens]
MVDEEKVPNDGSDYFQMEAIPEIKVKDKSVDGGDTDDEESKIKPKNNGQQKQTTGAMMDMFDDGNDSDSSDQQLKESDTSKTTTTPTSTPTTTPPTMTTTTTTTEIVGEKTDDKSDDKMLQMTDPTVHYREALLVPKRERRIIARYKVIIPVIVPNVRVMVPMNNGKYT